MFPKAMPTLYQQPGQLPTMDVQLQLAIRKWRKLTDRLCDAAAYEQTI
jgi:hypothetical protein